MSFLRFLVLSGLFLASNVFAYTVCTSGSSTAATPLAAAISNQATQTPAGFSAVFFSDSQRAGIPVHDIVFKVYRADGSFYQNSTQLSSCTCSIQQYSPFPFTTGYGEGAAPSIAEAFALLDDNGLPPSQCVDSCVQTYTATGATPYFDTGIFFGSTQYTARYKIPATRKQTGTTCIMPPPCSVGTLAGIAGTCVPDPDYCPPPNTRAANGVCKPPVPTCIPPQQLNAQNICETPMCPVGQVRKTSFDACTPIVCTPPLVKEGNFCVLPKCPSGETYEFKNGSGQCVKNDPICTPPQTLVNGVCKTPTCGTGMVLTSSGSCIPDPAINPNTKGSAGQSGTGTGASGTGTGSSGTGTGTGGTGTGSGTGGSGGGTGTGTGSTGTSTGGTTGGATGSAGGGGGGSGSSNTNTGGDGLCKTPPCGECDPATDTCGDTFGGSCKSGFQCNGDAIQCAVAQATNKAECDLKSIYVDTEVDPAFLEGKTAFDAGTKALGLDGGIPVTNGGNLEINSSNPLSSSCPADIQLFEYKGSQYKIPISNYCNIFQLMGNIMLLVASLISMKIIMKVD